MPMSQNSQVQAIRAHINNSVVLTTYSPLFFTIVATFFLLLLVVVRYLFSIDIAHILEPM